MGGWFWKKFPKKRFYKNLRKWPRQNFRKKVQPLSGWKSFEWMSYSGHRSIETKFKPGEFLANFLAFSRHHYCSGIIKNELSAQICRGNIPLKFQNKTTSQNMCKLREIQNSKIAAQHHTSARVSRCGHVRKCCSLSVTQHLSQCEYCYKKKQFMLLCNNHWL